jgi:hypothetical protein
MELGGREDVKGNGTGFKYFYPAHKFLIVATLREIWKSYCWYSWTLVGTSCLDVNDSLELIAHSSFQPFSTQCTIAGAKGQEHFSKCYYKPSEPFSLLWEPSVMPTEYEMYASRVWDKAVAVG